MLEKLYWKYTPLENLNDAQWEALCDGCGRCCLVRFEDEATGEIFYTLASCRLLDTDSCQCLDYDNRFDRVPGCLSIRRLTDREYRWLPVTCAYRIVHEREELPEWHPLLSGDQNSVVSAGVSVAGRVFNEDNIHPEEIEYLVLRD